MSVRCPGCRKPSIMLTLIRGTGATAFTEDKPSWCGPCLKAKIAAARAEDDCFCGDPTHPHGASL